MPDKDGAEEKTTKSVVNKRQKQMMGEEGYDIARDMGRVRPSKDKKDATTMPQSKKSKRKEVKGDTPMQKEFKKKYGKKATALDAVKQEYKGQIMKVEELDLTKVAEAFGGYIVEANGDDDKPKFTSGSFDPANQEGKFVKNEKKKRLRTDAQKKQDAEIAARKKQQVTQRASALDPRRPGFEDEEGQGVGFNAPKSERVPADVAKDMASSRKFSDRQQADMSKLLGNIAGTEGRAKGTVRRLSADQKRERDMAKLEAGRKAYIDPKTGKASPEGVKRYISKARQMRSGSNVPVDQKTTDVIATSAGQDYAKKIEDKYGGRRARKRGSNQPSFADVKSKIDAKNPTVRALMPAGSGKPLPDKEDRRLSRVKYRSAEDIMKDFVEKEKKKGKNLEDIKGDPRFSDIEKEAETTLQGRRVKSEIEKETGTKIRDFGLPRGTVTPGNERQSQPFKSFIDDTERLQQTSRAGALAGFVTKSLVPASAGIEAAQRYKSGDTRGAAISAVQAMDIPVLSKAAGVVNALRTLRRGKQASLDMSDRIDQNIKKSREPQPQADSGGPPVTTSGGKVVSGDGGKKKGDSGKSGGDKGSVGGGDLSDVLAANLPQVGQKVRRNLSKVRAPALRGRSGTRSARGGGGL